MLYAYPDICRMGLGNKLLVWARAEAFAADYGARVLKPGFVQFPSIGALLRGETSLRTNFGNFCFKGAGYIAGVRKWLLKKSMHLIDETAWTSEFKHGIVRFHGIGNNSFGVVLRHHEHIKNRLKTITNRSMLNEVEKETTEPFIGVHIRRGDFKQAGVLTPDEWYVTAILKAIELRSELKCIRVYSDGRPDELRFLDELKGRLSKRLVVSDFSTPLHDIWCLSKSTIMIGSSRSSFSIWAVLLGQMQSIWCKENAPRAKDLYFPNTLEPIVL